MALDRRIVIQLRAEDTFNEVGQPVLGEVTEYPVWAQQSGAGAADVPSEGGIVVSEARNYLVRWFRELAETPISRISVVDEYGDDWYPDTISESNARRRFMAIQAIRNVP